MGQHTEWNLLSQLSMTGHGIYMEEKLKMDLLHQHLNLLTNKKEVFLFLSFFLFSKMSLNKFVYLPQKSSSILKEHMVDAKAIFFSSSFPFLTISQEKDLSWKRSILLGIELLISVSSLLENFKIFYHYQPAQSGCQRGSIFWPPRKKIVTFGYWIDNSIVSWLCWIYI